MKTGWDAPLIDWLDEVKQYTNNEIKRLTKEAFAKIKAKTPVSTGELQAGWYIEEMISEGILSTVIANEVEYVVFIEYGSSKVAGRHMVETTLNELAEGVI